jgi:hypothetical protein
MYYEDRISIEYKGNSLMLFLIDFDCSFSFYDGTIVSMSSGIKMTMTQAW